MESLAIAVLAFALILHLVYIARVSHWCHKTQERLDYTNKLLLKIGTDIDAARRGLPPQ